MPDNAIADERAVHFIKRFRGAIRFGIRRAGAFGTIGQDAFQDVSLRIVQCFRSGALDIEGRAEEQLRDWAIITSERLTIDMMRKEGKHQRDVPGDKARGTLPSPDELVRKNDAQKRLNDALARLTPVQGHIMRLTMAGKGPKEIAEEQELSIDTVNRLLNRARTKLRSILGGLCLVLGMNAPAQWVQDSIAQDVRQLQRAVHFHQEHGVPDAYTLDSLTYEVAARTLDRLQHMALPCANPCLFSYSTWGPCIAGVQTRIVRDRSPPACAGWPQLERPCR